MPEQRPTAAHLFKSNAPLVSSPGSTVTGAHVQASQPSATCCRSRPLFVPDHLFLLDIETRQHTTGVILNTFQLWIFFSFTLFYVFFLLFYLYEQQVQKYSSIHCSLHIIFGGVSSGGLLHRLVSVGS